MKIIMHSNAPYVGTGYGNQTDLLTRQLQKDGHTVAISAFYGLAGATLTGEQGIPILPPIIDSYGNDALLYWHRIHKPDIMLSLIDVWVLQPELMRNVPITSWIPVDHDPMPPAVKEHSSHCATRIAMSKFGQAKFEEEDLDSIYIPHAVDTNTYYPMDRIKARDEVNVSQDAYTVTIVAANKGFPARKSFPEMIAAWAKFCELHPNIEKILYLHTVTHDIPYGIDLRSILSFYGVSPDTVRVADREGMLIGRYTPKHLNTIYNMSDLFLAAPRGEGFGIPILEAQASGTPVAVTDFTAQAELGEHGYKIPIVEDDLIYTEQNSLQCRPRVSEIVKALEWGLEHRGNTRLRKKARKFALGYDVEKVYQHYWKPNLPIMAERSRQHGFDPVAD